MNYNEAKRVVNALWRVREIIRTMSYEEGYKFYLAFMDSQNAQEFTDIFGIHKMHFYFLNLLV